MIMRRNSEKHPLFINGEWCKPVSSKYYDVISPATGEVIGQGPDCDNRDAEKAIQAAHHAFKTWSRTSAAERSNYLIDLSQLILENKEELAYIISTETGKPLREARLEVGNTANCILWSSEEAKRPYGDVIPSPTHNKRLHSIKQSLGPVAVITPWDYPLSETARKVAPALAAGCTVVLKSDSQTPGSVATLFQIVEKANLPDGVLNFVTGRTATIDDALVQDERIKKITYTGLSHEGHFLVNKAAAYEKSVSLDLGNQSPYLIFEDADLEKAVEGVIDIKFHNVNQTFSESTKIYVQEAVKAKFLTLLKARMEKLTIGDGLDESIDFGPVASVRNLAVLKNQVKDALDKGAKLISGGKRCIVPDFENGFYFEPTIIDCVNENIRLCSEDIYRPLVPIYTFSTEAEVIMKAKTSCNGPSLTIFTNDLSRSIRMAEELGNELISNRNDCGIDSLNEFLKTKFIAIGM